MIRVAVLSDSHDAIANLARTLDAVRASNANLLLHCGDLCAPFIVNQLAQGFAGPIHIVFGNNDGDGRLIERRAAAFDHVTLHDVYAEIEAGARTVGLIHYPAPARRIAQSGALDLVCYGHDHQAHAEQIDNCWLVNPGEIMGRFGTPSWGLYDCETHMYERQLLGE